VPFLVCGPFKVAPIREKAARIGKGAIPVTFRSRLRKAKPIAKKSGRGTRRPRAAVFSYNQWHEERKFNFFGWLERRARTPAKPGGTRRGIYLEWDKVLSDRRLR